MTKASMNIVLAGIAVLFMLGCESMKLPGGWRQFCRPQPEVPQAASPPETPEPLPEPEAIAIYRNMGGQNPPDPMPCRSIDGVLFLDWAHADLVKRAWVYVTRFESYPTEKLTRTGIGWRHAKTIYPGQYLRIVVVEEFERDTRTTCWRLRMDLTHYE